MKSLGWKLALKYDPLPALIGCGNEALVFWTNRYLLSKAGNSKVLSSMAIAQEIIRKQQPNGSWRYPSPRNSVRSSENYDQIETFRNMGYLIDMYGFDKSDIAIRKSTKFLLNFQTREGDIRGILGNQYTPYYTAAMLELFIRSGYSRDPRVLRAFKWLSFIRQADGGWAIPLRTQGQKLDTISRNLPTIQPDKTQPSSHMVTGIVLRAYAAHKAYRHSTEANTAGRLLLQSLFQNDKYPDRSRSDYWLKFTYPFWFTDLLSAMDTLSLLGFSLDDLQLKRAVDWFIDNQSSDGLWHLKTLKNQKKFHTDLWISLAISKVMKRLYDTALS